MIGNYSMNRPKEPLELADFSPTAARRRKQGDTNVQREVLDALKKHPGVRFTPGH